MPARCRPRARSSHSVIASSSSSPCLDPRRADGPDPLDGEMAQLRAGGSHVHVLTADAGAADSLTRARPRPRRPRATRRDGRSPTSPAAGCDSRHALLPMVDVDDLAARFARAGRAAEAEWTHVAHLAVGAWHVRPVRRSGSADTAFATASGGSTSASAARTRRAPAITRPSPPRTSRCWRSSSTRVRPASRWPSASHVCGRRRLPSGICSSRSTRASGCSRRTPAPGGSIPTSRRCGSKS